MFTLKAPAKINWFLSVLRKRQDGYHEILSLMQGISLYDYLTFEPSDTINVITEAAIPLEKNLVYKSAILLKEKFSVKDGATITLKKEIPMSAGLGGGSSNAAYTLIGLNKIWHLGLGIEELAKLSGMLGSDMPFFIYGTFAIVRGRGENVTRLKSNTSHVVLLVKPDLGIVTRWAYSEISKMLLKQKDSELTKNENNIKLLSQALERQDFKSIASLLKNDLELPVIREFKVIGELKDKLLEMGACASLMSGSGSTVFGIFENRETAEKAAEGMKPNWCKVVDTLV